MKRQILSAALASVLAMPALTGESWERVRTKLSGARPLQDGARVIAIDAPYRTRNDARTQIAAQIVAPRGLNIGKLQQRLHVSAGAAAAVEHALRASSAEVLVEAG